MSNSILVVYATRAGSTVEVAQAIAETLATRGFKVDVKPAKGKPEVEGYKAVMIGSGIRMGNWLPEAIAFVKKNQQVLNQVPVALFTVHMLNSGEDEESVANRLAYLNSVHPLITPVDEVFFTGKMDLSRLSIIDRLIAKTVKAVDEDKRDWDLIRDWALHVEI
ncbi:MAG: flavodoxin domain-containing protein [Anaerolineales bacterium]|nr:flavodoxin domain-containing protein [Anaerolineales bacterium]